MLREETTERSFLPRSARKSPSHRPAGTGYCLVMRSLVVIADESSIVGQVRLAARYAASVRVVATIDGRATIGSDFAALQPDVVLVSEMCQRVNTLSRLR